MPNTTIILTNNSTVDKSYDKMKICELAWTIKEDWRKQKGGVHPFAKQQLDAMMTLNTMSDKFIAEDGYQIVGSFLSNANTWKGEVARAVKKELNKRMKS